MKPSKLESFKPSSQSHVRLRTNTYTHTCTIHLYTRLSSHIHTSSIFFSFFLFFSIVMFLIVFSDEPSFPRAIYNWKLWRNNALTTTNKTPTDSALTTRTRRALARSRAKNKSFKLTNHKRCVENYLQRSYFHEWRVENYHQRLYYLSWFLVQYIVFLFWITQTHEIVKIDLSYTIILKKKLEFILSFGVFFHKIKCTTLTPYSW